MIVPAAGERQLDRVRGLLLRYGWTSTSYQLVNPGMAHWFSREGDAVVGYVDGPHCRVVAGAPVCAHARLPAVVAELERDAAAAGRRLLYFGAESRLASLCRSDTRHAIISLGAEPVWDPRGWARRIAEHASHRAQLHRARNKGVVVEEWPVLVAEREPALRYCLQEWLATRGLPPLHFLVEPDTLRHLEGRRIFVASRRGAIIAYLVLSPIGSRRGWLFEQWIRGAGSVNGTVDLMVHTAMTALAAEDVTFASLGLAPLSPRVPREPDEPLWLRGVCTWLRAHGRRFYNFAGLDQFKARLRPDTWDPVYAIAAAPAFGVRDLWAIAAAFSGGHPLHMVTHGLARAVQWELTGLPPQGGAP